MQDSFLTIKTKSESIYKEKGSKFIGIAVPVGNEEEVKTHLEALRKTYYDARHHCYAYILGQTGEKSRANDDGEPNHSAGDPILGQIRSKNLTNTLVVVVRYFGGTKLGVSGLINAYKTAAEEAISFNKIVEESITDTIEFAFEYSQMNGVMKLIKAFDIKILAQGYKDKSIITGKILVSKTQLLIEKTKLLNDTGYEIALTIEG